MDRSIAILERLGVEVDVLRAVDRDLAPGVQPDMREHGQTHDAWPALWPRVARADILVLGTPIWLGERSSVISRVIERLYAMSGHVNDHGQYVYYGKVGGVIVTGNEDGVKHCAMGMLYALQHLGFVVPPQADAGYPSASSPSTTRVRPPTSSA